MEGRTHRVVLRIDATHGEVLVRELLGATAARPRDARDADLRPVGSTGIDPSRPEAQRVWAKTVQTSFLDPERLTRTPVTLHEREVTLSEELTGALDDDGLLYVLCAVVTRSGYAWQPVFVMRS